MASLQKIESKRSKQSGRGAAPSHLWQKQVTLHDGRRTTIRLGAMSIKAAEETSRHIDHLIESKQYGTRLEDATKAWLQSADSKLTAKLAKIGLCGLVNNPTVHAFLDNFLERKKAAVGTATIEQFDIVAKHIREFFNESIRLSSVSSGDAKRLWHWLRTVKGLGENTAKRRLGRVREIFTDAVEQDIVSRNPFKLKSLSVAVGVATKDYIPADTIDAVIEHLPADKIEWKLLLAFGRYVGCRMPSEIRKLTWDDINWESNTILLHSPKTACKGKPSRMVPIFPEIADLLMTQAETVPPGTVYVFPILRNHTNTAVTARKFVVAAGRKDWPRFWNSLRASRETDLMDSVGLRRACAWIGNSPEIAIKHYALMRKTDYIDAGKGQSDASVANKGLTSAESDAKSDAARARTGENRREPKPADPIKSRKSKRLESASCPTRAGTRAKSRGKTAHSLKSDAESDARNLISDVMLLDLWHRATNEQRAEVAWILGAKSFSDSEGTP